MRTSRSTLIAAATAAVFCASASLTASGQTIMAPEKKVAATEKKVASAPASQPVVRSNGTHVYLLRGLMNIFSLGMDDLAEKLKKRGIATTVTNHAEWQTLSDEIAAKYKAGRHGPIVLIGHSYGADAVMQMGEYLGKKGVPVALIVPFDGTASWPATPNVTRVLNIYQRDYARMTKGAGFRGDLINYNVAKDPEIGHMNIDKTPRLHNMVISRVLALGARPAAPAGSSAPSAATPASAPSGASAQAAPHG